MLPVDDQGRNVFHALAALGEPREAAKLLSSTPKKIVSAGLLTKDQLGMTPLHIAALAGKLRVFHALADAVPEAEGVKCAEGMTARDMLKRRFVESPSSRTVGKLFQLDKLGVEAPEFDCDPLDTLQIAISSSSVVVIGRHLRGTFGDATTLMDATPTLYAFIKDELRHFDVFHPVQCATSNNHSLVLTADGNIHSWGKNINGILGLDVDEKVVASPQQIRETFGRQSSTRDASVNAFSALMDDPAATTSESLHCGVGCCDFFSVCYSKYRVYVWGANRGQMMNKEAKNAVAETPVLVYESNIKIKEMACCDGALALLLQDGSVVVLQHDRANPLAYNKSLLEGVRCISARGNHLAVLTKEYRLLRYHFLASSSKEEVATLWTPRHALDKIVHFDIAETGAAVVSTQRGVYRIENTTTVTELKVFRGMEITSLACDAHMHSFVGIAQLSVVERANVPIIDVKAHVVDMTAHHVDAHHVDAAKDNQSLAPVETPVENSITVLHVDDEEDAVVLVPHAVLYARCPSLRPLLSATSDKPVGVPGGSAIFRCRGGIFTVSHIPQQALQAFVTYLCGTDSEVVNGRESYEYHALRRLATRTLGEGLWDARLAGVGCDVCINEALCVHSNVLESASPVLRVQLERWTAQNALDGLGFSDSTLEDVLRYIYTAELNAGIQSLGLVEQAQRYFDLWMAADVLLIPSLEAQCENRLLEMLDYEFVVPFLEVALPLRRNKQSSLADNLLTVCAERIQYFIQLFSDMENEIMDRIENIFQCGTTDLSTNHTELAESYSSLKSQSQLQRVAGSVKKQGRKLSSPLHRPNLQSIKNEKVESQAVVFTDKAIAQPVATLPKSTMVKSKTASPATSSETSSSSGSSANGSSSGSGSSEGGWIQAGKKQRQNSDSHDCSAINSGILTVPPSHKAHRSPSPSSSPLRPVSSLSSVSPSPSSSITTPSWSSIRTTPDTSIGSIYSSPNNSVGSLPRASPLAFLPKLGGNLPSLGSTKSTPAPPVPKAPRPKFSQKGSKHLVQFDSPALLAQQLERDLQVGPPTSSPWKTMPVSQPSLSILERLEKTRPKKGVWGV